MLRYTLDNIENIENRHVSPNRPLALTRRRKLNREESENPFIDSESYRRNMYYLDFLLTQNITVLTGTRNRVYKGLHVVCNDEEKTCKYKVLNEEIEAAGDCFFHCALYNLGKKYLGKIGLTKKEQRDNKENANRFRKMLVGHYKDQLGLHPTRREMAEADGFLEQYAYVDSVIAKAYADKCNRSVCIFTIGNPDDVLGGGFTVELILNKYNLGEKLDFFIHTQGPAHYTTLKRLPGFETNDIMRRLLEYEHQGVPLWRDINIQHDNTERPKFCFGDRIRTYNINGPKDIYRLFQTDWPYEPLPDFSLDAVEVLPVPEGLNNMTPRTRSIAEAIIRGESPPPPSPRAPSPRARSPHFSPKGRPQRSHGSPRERLAPRSPRYRPRPKARPPVSPGPNRPHSIPPARISLAPLVPPLAPLKPLDYDYSKNIGLAIGANLEARSGSLSSRTRRALNEAGRSPTISPRTRKALNEAAAGRTPRSRSSSRRSRPRVSTPRVSPRSPTISPRTRRALNEAIRTPRSSSRSSRLKNRLNSIRVINNAPNVSPATKERIAQIALSEAPNASLNTMNQIAQLDRARSPRASPRRRRFRMSSIVNKHIPRLFGFGR
jgi:hypothetical protein